MDINGSEFLIIALLALILVGPERLPEYVRGLRNVVLRLRTLIRDGQDALKDEWGDDVDWSQLDPRTYDPRRIVREALFDDEDVTSGAGTAAGTAPPSGEMEPAATGSRRERRDATRPRNPVAKRVPDGVATDLTPVDLEAT